MQKTVVSTPRILPRACGERAYVLLDVSPVRRGDGGLPTHREHPPLRSVRGRLRVEPDRAPRTPSSRWRTTC